jgi:hypothetical protein
VSFVKKNPRSVPLATSGSARAKPQKQVQHIVMERISLPGDSPEPLAIIAALRQCPVNYRNESQ